MPTGQKNGEWEDAVFENPRLLDGMLAYPGSRSEAVSYEVSNDTRRGCVRCVLTLHSYGHMIGLLFVFWGFACIPRVIPHFLMPDILDPLFPSLQNAFA